METRYALSEETNVSPPPPCSGLKLMHLSNLQPQNATGMSDNTLHRGGGGSHKFTRTKQFSSPQQSLDMLRLSTLRVYNLLLSKNQHNPYQKAGYFLGIPRIFLDNCFLVS